MPAVQWVTAGGAQLGATANSLTVRQQTDRAILNWQNFNIGRGNTVRFEQPSSSSVALNRIHQADPSRILGTLTANGQVYLVNQNGFLFGPDSRVDVNSLVASTLDISEQALERGISKFINDSVDQSNPLAALSGNGDFYLRDDNGNLLRDAAGKLQRISITLAPGAHIATNAAGGRILLAAPSVENRGEIVAGDGQALLVAATDKVYLQEADPQSDIRGLLVEVATGGEVTNLGQVVADRGNATLLGFAVNQKGVVQASTAVNLNGTVRLLAREGAQLQTVNGSARLLLQPRTTQRGVPTGDSLGTSADVTLSGGSHTAVVLDTTARTAVDDQAQPKSAIELAARRITLANEARISARGGRVTLTASEHPDVPLATTSGSNGSHITLAAGSHIDVSGLRNVELPMQRHQLDVEVRTNEIRDAPRQKNGVLQGRTVTLDGRTANRTIDTTGARARVQRTVQERTTTGGAVVLNSEGGTTVHAGARIDIAGGSVRYAAGFVTSTWLTAFGRIYNLADADPDLRYDGIAGEITKVHRKWGVAESWQVIPGSAHVPQYDEGKAAGSLAIKTRDSAFAGTLNADTVYGLYQRDAMERPSGGRFSLDLAWSHQAQPAVRFSHARPSALDEQVFADDFARVSGVSDIDILTAGLITLDASSVVTLPAAGRLSLTGGQINLNGTVVAPGGTVTLRSVLPTVSAPDIAGDIRLSVNARVDTRGLWTNDTPQSASPLMMDVATIHGGAITFDAYADLLMPAGAMLDASGGAWLEKSGALQYGHGGDITLRTYGLGTHTFELGATLTSYALMTGGTLNLTANAITVSAADRRTSDIPGQLTLAAPSLLDGGFSRYALTSNAGNVRIESGVNLALAAKNLAFDQRATRAPNGTPLTDVARVVTLPLEQRAPVNLAFTVRRTIDGPAYQPDADIVMETGSVITSDPGGTFTLSSDHAIRIDGRLVTPGGIINLRLTALGNDIADLGFDAGQAIRLGNLAQLDARGSFVRSTHPLGFRTGKVLNGGNVTLQADRGYVAIDRGASIDVSGIGTILDLPGRATGIDNPLIKPYAVGSAGGNIALIAAEGIFIDGDLRGAPGDGPGAIPGELTVTLDTTRRSEPSQTPSGATPYPRRARIIEVGRLTSANPVAALDGPIPMERNGLALLDPSLVTRGEFGSLTLRTVVTEPFPATQRGAIRFKGDISLDLPIQLILDAPIIDWAASDASPGNIVALSAPHVALGSSLEWQSAAASTLGDGRLDVHGQLLELVGSTTLHGFAQSTLRSTGDLRMRGNLVQSLTAQPLRGDLIGSGDITLQARQIYPTTLTDFSIKLESPGRGTLRVLPADTAPDLPLSAAGRLRFSAANIFLDGTIRAPFGTLEINAGDQLIVGMGGLLSTTASNTTIPFGRLQGGFDWIYPLGTTSLILDGSPAKSIVLNATRVDLQPGATLDLSGGGDLHAFEFIAGPGGSRDLLAASGANGAFAVLSDLGSGWAPFDPLESPSSALDVRTQVHLDGTSGLPEGTFARLPAHYALLPGAFLVTPVAGTRDLTPGTRLSGSDGAPIVSGYYSTTGTAFRDVRTQGFVVEPGAIARSRAEYDERTASSFFHERSGARIPGDAGNVAIAAMQSLNLAAAFTATTLGGRGGWLDIQTDRIRIARDGSPSPSGVLGINERQLNALNLESVFLGGTRVEHAQDTRLNVATRSIQIQPGVNLIGSEFLFAARDSIDIGAGATIEAAGAMVANPALLSFSDAISGGGTGALLRVSTGGAAQLVRQGALDTSRGSLQIASGAMVRSAGSILIDATATTNLRGRIDMPRGVLTLGADHINLGAVPDFQPGMTLTPVVLGASAPDALFLNARTAINLFGPTFLSTRNLTLNTPALRAVGDLSPDAVLNADRIVLTNGFDTPAPSANIGRGALALNAGEIVLGPGNIDVTGFSHVSLDASDALLGQGTSTLAVHGDLTLTAGVIQAGAAAETRIVAAGHHLSTRARANGKRAADAGLGARVSLVADYITHGGVLELTGGTARLEALVGDIELLADSVIDVSGRRVFLREIGLDVDAGRIVLDSMQGNVRLSPQASVAIGTVSGNGNSGSLTVAAPDGQFIIGGALSAGNSGSGRGAQLNLRAAGWNTDTFDQLLNAVMSSGPLDSVAITQNFGNISLDETSSFHAHDIALTAQRGRIQIDGELNAVGASAGRIALNAADTLTLGPSGRLRASATGIGATGGMVMLTSSRAPTDHRRSISIAAGSRIEVAGGAHGTGGTVMLRVARDGNEVSVDVAEHTVSGAARMEAEAVRTYAVGNDYAVTTDDISHWRADTAAFMASSGSNATHLAGFNWLPGVELTATGDLTLATAWDLLAWRFQAPGQTPFPGTLTLRAGGALILDATLSDAFAFGALPGASPIAQPMDLLQPDRSWSYRLVAGADLDSPDPLATDSSRATGRDITLGRAVTVRTGTGSIDVAAADSIRLTDESSAIYTAGRPTDSERYGSFGSLFARTLFYGEYPVDGGSISLRAGRDVIGAATTQLMSDWLVRNGTWDPANPGAVGMRPTAWAIAFDNLVNGAAPPNGNQNIRRGFRQNVGTLGGGDVRIESGGNIIDLSVMLPTTGKPTGAFNNGRFTANTVDVQGGGDLVVDAAGDLLGGTFYVERGSADLRVAGDIRGGNQYTAGPLLALGDTRMSMTAGGDVLLGAAFNPLLLRAAVYTDKIAMFATYTDASALQLTALGGNLVLNNDTSIVADQFKVFDNIVPSGGPVLATTEDLTALTIYPGSLSALAPSGNLEIVNGMSLFPSAIGSLQLIARRDLIFGHTDNVVIVNQSDIDPARLPSIAKPAKEVIELTARMKLLSAPPTGDVTFFHAPTLLHKMDLQPARVMADQGSVLASASSLLSAAEPLWISAGLDLDGLSILLQNLRDQDVSQIEAGRDLRYATHRDPSGGVLNLNQRIEVAGPGLVQVRSGRNIDLGTSKGITSVGDTLNPALPDTGASLAVWAGVRANPDFVAFVKQYLGVSADSRRRLRDSLALFDSPAPPADTDLLAAFSALDEPWRRDFAQSILFDELRESGAAAASEADRVERARLYERGFDAIAGLFGRVAGGGNISLYFSKLQTIDGGDINLLAPFGDINIGLASAFSGQKPSSELGVVVQRSGNFNALASGDFDVNQSRVFTLGGGDITIWSSNGDIDAGRGAKAAITTPAPVPRLDERGNLVVDFPPTVAGSGIRAQAGTLDGSDFGDVTLAAPKGFIDAGEAGIAGQNVRVGALAIIGADNIAATDFFVGGPPPVVAIAAGLTGINNLTSQAATLGEKGMQRQTAENAAAQTPPEVRILTTIDVRVLDWDGQ